MMPAMTWSQRMTNVQYAVSALIKCPLISPTRDDQTTISRPTPAASVFSSDWKNAAMEAPVSN